MLKHQGLESVFVKGSTRLVVTGALWPQINWKSKVASGITARMQSCCLKEYFFLNLSLCSYLR